MTSNPDTVEEIAANLSPSQYLEILSNHEDLLKGGASPDCLLMKLAKQTALCEIADISPTVIACDIVTESSILFAQKAIDVFEPQHLEKVERIYDIESRDLTVSRLAENLFIEDYKTIIDDYRNYQNRNDITKSLLYMFANNTREVSLLDISPLTVIRDIAQQSAIRFAKKWAETACRISQYKRGRATGLDIMLLGCDFDAPKLSAPQEPVNPKSADMNQLNFQGRVTKWLYACFTPKDVTDKAQRTHRFVEESLELAQATGCTKEEVLQLVDYVYGRDKGEEYQEVGGVMMTLSALCSALELDMQQCGETELARVWTCIDKIRAKQAQKEIDSPLPGRSPEEADVMHDKNNH